MIKAVLFDMDGVLVDTMEIWMFLFNKLRKRFGQPEFTREQYIEEMWGTPIEKELEYFPEMSIKDITSYYDSEFQKSLDKVRLLGSSDKVLAGLKGKYRLGVCSNTPTAIVEKILKAAGIYEYFNIVVGTSESLKGKPEPDMLNYAAGKLRAKETEAVFVGDTSIDIEAAKNAGMASVGLDVEGADYTIKALTSLTKIIENMK
jgi:HAD superfamily hydrolase (TIGR01509 family)